MSRQFNRIAFTDDYESEITSEPASADTAEEPSLHITVSANGEACSVLITLEEWDLFVLKTNENVAGRRSKG